MRIDVHAHYFPETYLAYLERLGGADFARVPLRAPGARISIADRINLLDKLEIELQVLSITSYLPQLDNERDMIELTRLANNLYTELSSRYPRRFAAFGALPLPFMDATLSELTRCLDDLKMLGVSVGCTIAGRPLDDLTFAPLLAELDRRGTVVFLHPQGTGCGPGSKEFGLTWLVGAAVEDTLAALRFIISGLVDRYQNIRIIVPHLGGVLPFLQQRIDDLWEHSSKSDNNDSRSPVGIKGYPSQHYRRLWYDTVNSNPSALRCALNAFGPDRLLLGTDFPWIVGERWTPLVDYIVRSNLPKKVIANILGGNAHRLLNVPFDE